MASATEKMEENGTILNRSNSPNVIIIYADDLGYGDLECFGAKNVHIPNVNRLAEQGIRFTNVHLSVRTKDWKYIEPHEGSAMIQWGPKVETGDLQIPQLYDMKVNDYEKENIAEQYPSIVYELQKILRKVKEQMI